jgi:anaerobic sulfite reductase subunit A
MGYHLSEAEFDAVLNRLKCDYRIFGPAEDVDGGSLADTDMVTYREIHRLADLTLDRKSAFSPKEVLYPIRETLFHFVDGEHHIPEIDDKKIIILLRPCDLNGIERLDDIFLENGAEPDFYYQRRRENVRFFLIECTTGFPSCWCVAMDANTTDRFDAAFRFGDPILADVKSDEFKPYFSTYPETPFTVEFIQENEQQVRIPKVEDISTSLFENELWQTYTPRCIACGRCNTACITCSCFTMQDVAFGTGGGMGERRRCWTGCQIDGFTTLAGGHRFREKNGDKLRYKAMHKINDFYKRFGRHQCVGCGRCDDVCPQYISFARCINTLSTAIDEEKRQ